MVQTATSGNLARAQRTIIAAVRYTEEHNAPALALIESMSLQRGASTVTVPKVGQMTFQDLVDGEDMVDTEDIGMTTVDLTAAEVGAKVIVTDKLVRQSQPSVFSMIGRQLGDGAARKQDDDVTALYTNLNGGTAYGGTDALLNASNFAGAIATGRGKTSNPFNPTYAVEHPHAVYEFVRSTTAIGSATNNFPDEFQMDKLRKFWSGRTFNGVALFEDGNIAVASGQAIGVLAQKDALVVLKSKSFGTERQRDASLRAWEINMVADYGVFELDDTKGAPLNFKADAPTTNLTA
jgi:hypothetical protein